jgi:hypothetical protein
MAQVRYDAVQLKKVSYFCRQKITYTVTVKVGVLLIEHSAWTQTVITINLTTNLDMRGRNTVREV